jgi:hypothetical protein
VISTCFLNSDEDSEVDDNVVEDENSDSGIGT